MADPTHGKPTTYTNHKCRCRPCRDAWAARVREQRARRAQTGREQPDTIPHGNNGYENYHCRCETCRAAHAAVRREQRDRNSDATPSP